MYGVGCRGVESRAERQLEASKAVDVESRAERQLKASKAVGLQKTCIRGSERYDVGPVVGLWVQGVGFRA